MKKSTKIIISASAAFAVAIGVTAVIIGLSIKEKADREDLYNKGLKHLIDAEYKDATEIFAKPTLRNYKDTSKKYSYSFNLQRYEQRTYSYETLINYGLEESGSVAIIDFDTKGGNEIPRKTITEQKEGAYITETAVKQHYDFVSWKLSYACYELESDSIRYFLESNYNDHPYNITYTLDGGSEVGLPKTYYYNHGNVAIPNTSKTGHTFLGYESDLYDTPKDNFVIPNGTYGDLNLKAKFEANTYKVTFDVLPNEVDVTYGQDVTGLFPSPTKNFYTFDYWTYKGEPLNLTSWNIAQDVQLVAKFSLETYNINYILNGAANPGLPETYNYESVIEFPFVEKENACFIGWKKDALDPNPKYSIKNEHGDHTIEACFVDATIVNGVLTDVADHTIKEIVIPSYVNDVSPDLFPQLESLINIYVDAKNTHFKVINSLLIKDDTVVVAYPRNYANYHTVVNLPNTITEIGEKAFKDTVITEVNGSDLVTKINHQAFNNCASLTEVNLTNVEYIGNSSFVNTKITSDFFNANKTSINYIGESAFKNTLINEVEILSNVKAIGDNAFANLSGLTSVDIYPDPTCIFGDHLFDGSNNIVTLNTNTQFFEKLMSSSFDDHSLKTINLNGSTNIKNDVCKNYASLQTLDLSASSINQIGAQAFMGDTSLKTVTLPSQMTRINASAFEGCSKLDTLNFDSLENLFSIKEYAFKDAAFTTLDFTNNPHLTIEDHAFNSNTELTSITMYHGQVVTRVADVFDLCHKISNITYVIPETDQNIVEIPNFLFENLNNVTNINIQYLGTDNKEIKFGMYAFKDDSSLEDVTMTNCHATIIPKHCFEGCVSFTNENNTFSDMIHYDEGAFFGCVNLAYMSFNNTTIIGDDAFAGCYSLCSNGPIVIPRIDDNINLGVGVFADITGVIEFTDYTQAEVEALTLDATCKWWHFDEGYSGTFVYKP